MTPRRTGKFLALLLCLGGRLLGESPAGDAAGPHAIESYPLCATPPNETEPNGTAATATTMQSPCWANQGAISPSLDVDYYRLNAINASRVWVLVDCGSPPAQANGHDSVLELLDIDGTTVLETDDDDGIGNGGDGTVENSRSSAIAGHTVSGTGFFYLRIQSFDTNPIDHYHVVIMTTFAQTEIASVEPNDTPATATTTVSSPEVRSAQISPGGESDFYRLAAKAGDELFISADGNPERDGSNTDVDLELRAADGTTVLLSAVSPASNDGKAAAAFRFVVVSTGTYFVRAFGHDALTTGTYDLLIAGNTELLVDGFASSGTGAWSSTQP